MKRFSLLLVLFLGLFAACNKEPMAGDNKKDTPAANRTGESGISYQVLIYSFSDSDGNGTGDFKGIQNRLDYFKSLGVQALWLSPANKATSYHGYDVEDYEAVNPQYGTEQDFSNLINAAHSKGIKIYMDFVLNHSSKNHPWFLEGKSSTDSKYRNYYNFSSSQKSGWSQTVSGDNPGKIKVKFTLSCDAQGKPKTLTAQQTDNIVNSGTPASNLYLWYGSVNESTMPCFYSNGSNSYSLSLELDTEWGVLVRTSKTEWGESKYGAESGNDCTLEWGHAVKLKSNSDTDVLMPWMKPVWYQSVFGSYMPDLNYGPAGSCENSDAFKDVCKAADKWIKLGIDGFRLDAVKHIYDNENSDENPTFLSKFYEHCNATFKSCGHSGNIYMVGEQWNEPDKVIPYYKGLNAYFEFAFWWKLTEAINSGNAAEFANTIEGYHSRYKAVRSDAIAATKLTNHDEDRAASTLGRNLEKLKLCSAVLLTCSGEPYIYQGEELGYWGTKANGDEYVRTPVLWSSSDYLADAQLAGKIDRSMLTESISVKSQEENAQSLLSVYKTFGVLRDSYPALAKGSMSSCFLSGSTDGIASWYREYEGQRILVVHNFGSQVSLVLSSQNCGTVIASNGKASLNGEKLILGKYASILILL